MQSLFTTLLFFYEKRWYGIVACKEDVMLYFRISRHSWHSNHKHSLLKKKTWDGMGAGPFAYIRICMPRVKKHYLPSFLWLLSIELISAAAFLLDIVVINPQFAMCGQFNGLHAIGEKKDFYIRWPGEYIESENTAQSFCLRMCPCHTTVRGIQKGDVQSETMTFRS